MKAARIVAGSSRGAARQNLKFVELTQAQYDALDPPNANTLYFITDAE